MKEANGMDETMKEAAVYGRCGMLRSLLEAGADVHSGRDAALRSAAYYGHDVCVQLLLEAGADVHAEEDEALRVAAGHGHAECVQLLINAGANIHARGDQALRSAAKAGSVECVQLLLEAGADVHARNDEALRSAAIFGHTECVQLLLEAGADVHAEEDEALRVSLECGYIACALVLLAEAAVLSEREKNIIVWRFGLDGGKPKTLEEVGKKFGVKRERIRQLQNRALWKLLRVSLECGYIACALVLLVEPAVLSELEKKIIVWRFGLDGGKPKTLEEVGKKFGVKRERIRQLQNRALWKLRRVAQKYGLETFGYNISAHAGAGDGDKLAQMFDK
jgi:hypothetical protein